MKRKIYKCKKYKKNYQEAVEITKFGSIGNDATINSPTSGISCANYF